MLPIQALLNRIRWDREFGRGNFEVAYYDRVEKRLVRVPLDCVQFPAGSHFFLAVTTPDGEPRSVPVHRIRAVSRDGHVIWARHPAA